MEKIYDSLKCPYCGHEYLHKFYVNETSVYCKSDKCGDEFEIEVVGTYKVIVTQ